MNLKISQFYSLLMNSSFHGINERGRIAGTHSQEFFQVEGQGWNKPQPFGFNEKPQRPTT